MQLDQGQRLGNYVIRGPIGSGGMGEVYRAHDTTLDRDVAIKVLPQELSAHPDRRARFEREAKAVAALNHENIVVIHAIGEERGVRFLAMELVEGETLDQRVPESDMTSEEVVAMATPIASALAAAHAKGIVHRDLKPANVMVTTEGKTKILDFGLAKLVDTEDSPTPILGEDTETELITLETRVGTLVGTLPYMSPEQLSGRGVGPASDVFSFGVMLYELATGGRPFRGDTEPALISSILTETPEPAQRLQEKISDDVGGLIEHCLAKDPADRPSDGAALLVELERLRSASAAEAVQMGSKAAGTGRHRATVAVVSAGLVIAIAFWFGLREQTTRRARNHSLPEIQRLFDIGDRDAAFRLLRETRAVIPGDPVLEELDRSNTMPLLIETVPPGAEIAINSYKELDRPWIELGTAPVEVRLPVASFRLRATGSGYETFEGVTREFSSQRIELVREDEAPTGMVRIPTGEVFFGGERIKELEEFWIDRHEVTNARFKEFVDAGGYRQPDLWPTPIEIGGEIVPLEEAVALFFDTTGRPGPAGWELGSYPDGAADLPVGGISWYEAEAFAEWSGAALPTVFHWHRAASQGLFSDIIQVSNFDGAGPAPVGSYRGLGPFGTYDMAGNIREWCHNRHGGARYILGGAWSDPSYRFRDTEALDPLDRSPKNGIRTMRTIAEPMPESLVVIDRSVFDFRGIEPVNDEIFGVLKALFSYDLTDLDSQIVAVEDHSDHWRRERLTIKAAYGDERLPAFLYLPKNVDPPYQTVVLFPSSAAVQLTDSRNPSLFLASFIIRSGRALMYPIYQGTYERRFEIEGHNDRRDWIIQAGKDLRRSIDYLETRDDIDDSKLAFCGISLGASWGPVFTAIENRFDASILLAGGMAPPDADRPPETVPLNFMPRSTVPVLMINGRNDLWTPLETEIQPMFDLQGAPPEHKQLVVLDGGHIPDNPKEFIRAALDWLDLYLGPVD